MTRHGAGLLGVMQMLACGAAFAHAWPDKTVRVIVPMATGGDIVARITSTKLSETLGQQFIVDNRGDGGLLRRLSMPTARIFSMISPLFFAKLLLVSELVPAPAIAQQTAGLFDLSVSDKALSNATAVSTDGKVVVGGSNIVGAYRWTPAASE